MSNPITEALRLLQAQHPRQDYRPPVNQDNRCLLDTLIFDGGAGQRQSYQGSRQMTHIVVSVTTGAIDIYFGAAGGGTIPRVPSLHFGQTNRPETVPLPAGVQNFLAVSSGVGTNLACVIVEGL